ncbi:MAG: hypothetical protein ACP5D7_00925 [Limnospira sp.]
MNVSMVEDFSFQMDRLGDTDIPNRKTDREATSELLAHPETDASNVTLLPPPPATRIRLALEQLEGFEPVEDQFRHWGIKFINAIALQPSNPRFSIEPGVTVLMGAPKGGTLEVSFTHPVRQVVARVTSPHTTMLSACDRDGTLIAQDEMAVSKSGDSLSSILPSRELRVRSKNIYKVTFYTFDAQLIVDRLQVEF